jgi:DNA repair exonuclease SbcCD ATPase subunit
MVKGWNDMRCIYVAYGDVSKIQLKPSAKPLDALLYTGFDLYVEVAPKQWVRAVDLPENHPANVNLSAGAYKAGLVDANGQQITILNAFNPEHRALASREGLHIAVPYSEDKREEILKTLEKIREELQTLTESRFMDLRNRIDKIKTRLEVLKGIHSLEKEIAEKEKLQAKWDSTINDAANMLEEAVKLSNMIFPTNYEKLAFQEAVKRAKREAALEAAIQESLLLNPELLRDLRRRLLED